MPPSRENRSIREELFALRERWRGNALSALARIDRIKQNVLDALSGNLELFRGGFLNSTNQPLTIGALQIHNLGEAAFGVTGLFHNYLQGILRESPEIYTAVSNSTLRFVTLAFVLPHHHKRLEIVSRLSTSSVHTLLLSLLCSRKSLKARGNSVNLSRALPSFSPSNRRILSC